MLDDNESKPPESPMPEETMPVEEFPEKLHCPQCRRMFLVKGLRAKSNTLLTEAALVCPRCRRKLRRMKLKDWYDHYVQGQEKDFKLDAHGFVHTDPPGEGSNALQVPDPRAQRPPRGQSQGPRNRRGGPNWGSDNRQNQRGQQSQPQKKSLLPQNVRAYRLPKKRRLR